jgi:hypothetical protein
LFGAGGARFGIPSFPAPTVFNRRLPWPIVGPIPFLLGKFALLALPFVVSALLVPVLVVLLGEVSFAFALSFPFGLLPTLVPPGLRNGSGYRHRQYDPRQKQTATSNHWLLLLHITRMTTERLHEVPVAWMTRR